jgi:hypothetical protein
MSPITFRTRLLAALGVPVAAAALAVVGQGAAPAPATATPCTSCHGDQHGEQDPMVWLEQYEHDQATIYAESPGVMAGPDGQGDYRPHGDVPGPYR